MQSPRDKAQGVSKKGVRNCKKGCETVKLIIHTHIITKSVV